MSAKENPGVATSGALEEITCGAVSDSKDTSFNIDFPLTPADEARARAAVHDGVINADRRATKEMFNQLARRAGNDPRLSRGGTPYAKTAAELSKIVCNHFLRAEQVPMLRKVSPDTVSLGLRGAINDAIEEQNEQLKRDLVVGKKIMHITRLSHAEIARLMAALYPIRRLQAGPRPKSEDPLIVYIDDAAAPGYGTYEMNEEALDQIARRYQPDLTTKEFVEVLAALKGAVARVHQSTDPDLVACRNGLVDYNGGDPVFHDFSPEHVVLAKLDVDWNPDAQNPVIDTPDGDQWDVESWMSSLSDDPEVVELLWQTTGAITRPRVRWDRCAFYYDERGNNGKGTLLSLQRNLLGEGGSVGISLADLGTTHGLEPLIGAGPVASAILTDENDVGTFIEKAANFKALITHDVITVNPKHRAMVNLRWFGFMIQCINDLPTIKDKSDSIYRRQLFIPFTKSFTGRERKYIKDEYLKRSDVLEYVLRRVLTMSYYELSEPLAVKALLGEFKEYNDPVRAFWNEIKTQLYWDLVPFQFAYDLFVAWMKRNMPNSRPVGKIKFIKELVALVQADPEGPWECKERQAQHSSGTRMDATEPLIAEYNLLDWANVAARDDAKKFARIPGTKLKRVYRGLMRREGDASFLTREAEGVADNTVAPSAYRRPLTAEALLIPEEETSRFPAKSAVPDDTDGGPVPDAPGDDARPPARTLSPERAAALTAEGLFMGPATDTAEAVTR